MTDAPTDGQGNGPSELTLADWRRRIAELYAEVRGLATGDPAHAHRLWRDTREWLYREHPQSPVPPADRTAFRALHHPYDDSLRFEVAVEPPPEAVAEDAARGAGRVAGAWVALPNSGQDDLRFRAIGRLTLPFAGRPLGLTLFWMEGYAGGLFLPFGDATNGDSTYGAGRYVLDAAKGADLGPGRETGSIVVDLNFAYQPSCAFDPRWACPLTPPENGLDIRVEAGERLV